MVQQKDNCWDGQTGLDQTYTDASVKYELGTVIFLLTKICVSRVIGKDSK